MTELSHLRFAVFGTGAVGAYCGGRLAEAGQDVSFIARGPALQAIRDHGLRVSSPQGDFTVHPAHASNNPADLQ
jgi:2-dehydropantoate 2-reductase